MPDGEQKNYDLPSYLKIAKAYAQSRESKASAPIDSLQSAQKVLFNVILNEIRKLQPDVKLHSFEAIHQLMLDSMSLLKNGSSAADSAGTRAAGHSDWITFEPTPQSVTLFLRFYQNDIDFEPRKMKTFFSSEIDSIDQYKIEANKKRPKKGEPREAMTFHSAESAKSDVQRILRGESGKGKKNPYDILHTGIHEQPVTTAREKFLEYMNLLCTAKDSPEITAFRERLFEKSRHFSDTQRLKDKTIKLAELMPSIKMGNQWVNGKQLYKAAYLEELKSENYRNAVFLESYCRDEERSLKQTEIPIIGPASSGKTFRKDDIIDISREQMDDKDFVGDKAIVGNHFVLPDGGTDRDVAIVPKLARKLASFYGFSGVKDLYSPWGFFDSVPKKPKSYIEKAAVATGRCHILRPDTFTNDKLYRLAFGLKNSKVVRLQTEPYSQMNHQAVLIYPQSNNYTRAAIDFAANQRAWNQPINRESKNPDGDTRVIDAPVKNQSKAAPHLKDKRFLGIAIGGGYEDRVKRSVKATKDYSELSGKPYHVIISDFVLAKITKDGLEMVKEVKGGDPVVLMNLREFSLIQKCLNEKDPLPARNPVVQSIKKVKAHLTNGAVNGVTAPDVLNSNIKKCANIIKREILPEIRGNRYFDELTFINSRELPSKGDVAKKQREQIGGAFLRIKMEKFLPIGNTRLNEALKSKKITLRELDFIHGLTLGREPTLADYKIGLQNLRANIESKDYSDQNASILIEAVATLREQLAPNGHHEDETIGNDSKSLRSSTSTLRLDEKREHRHSASTISNSTDDEKSSSFRKSSTTTHRNQQPFDISAAWCWKNETKPQHATDSKKLNDHKPIASKTRTNKELKGMGSKQGVCFATTPNALTQLRHNKSESSRLESKEHPRNFSGGSHDTNASAASVDSKRGNVAQNSPRDLRLSNDSKQPEHKQFETISQLFTNLVDNNQRNRGGYNTFINKLSDNPADVKSLSNDNLVKLAYVVLTDCEVNIPSIQSAKLVAANDQKNDQKSSTGPINKTPAQVLQVNLPYGSKNEHYTMTVSQPAAVNSDFLKDCMIELQAPKSASNDIAVIENMLDTVLKSRAWANKPLYVSNLSNEQEQQFQQLVSKYAVDLAEKGVLDKITFSNKTTEPNWLTTLKSTHSQPSLGETGNSASVPRMSTSRSS